ncbi:MAG: hypothetical protein J6Z02_05170 [Lachnospiraceae bacterium]|nr:hypothetical protein [Lachnospiraceae bacterium]
MARILNLIIVILEIIGFTKSLKKQNLLKSFVFYTQISNCFALVSSILLVFLGQKPFVEVLRFLSVSMLIMTFLVTTSVLVPMSGSAKGLLFSGSGLFHHLLVPVLATVSYIFAEDRVSLKWAWLPIIFTLIYGLLMLYLNQKGKISGPYPFFMIRNNGAKLTTIWMVILMLVISAISLPLSYKKSAKTDLKYIYVHGLSGWGSYDTQNDFIPYWGLTGGSVIRHMNSLGYESYAASVDPTGSAWDRACELYAQLTGTRVDYGAAHSAAAGHERFGRDFSKEPLVKDFDSSRFVLIGHSFGGATIRLFSEILKNGSEAERAANAPDTSDFFKGGNGDGLVALVTLAAPTNGTTAYDMYEDESFDTAAIEIPSEYEKNSNAVSRGTKPTLDGRASWDYASFDMHIDNALALNDTITTFDDVYYFAYPYDSTSPDANGKPAPDPSITENIFMKGAIIMSKYSGVTKGGFVIDDSWKNNDGLVNTASAGAPIGAPSASYSESASLNTGVWYVMPVQRGDHMSPQGGLTKRVNVKPFYENLAKMLADLK